MYLCSPVKTSAAHNFTRLYGPTENVQNEATILTARRKYGSCLCVEVHYRCYHIYTYAYTYIYTYKGEGGSLFGEPFVTPQVRPVLP